MSPNNIKTHFSINDLENFSQIKAHTIRIWEKRYKLLKPSRHESGIRFYDIDDLKKLLNVCLLYNNGLKISKIAQLNTEEIQSKVREQMSIHGDIEFHINQLSISMLNFDTSMFNAIYYQLLEKCDFSELFIKYLIPFLQNIGLEWQSSAITPAHEHFASNLIRQKIQVQIELIQREGIKNKDQKFILFLPLNETHELGLLFTHYYLLSKGFESIYLGQSIDLDDLPKFEKEKVSYVTSSSTASSKEDLDALLKRFTAFSKETLYISGKNSSTLESLPKSIIRLDSLNELSKIV